VTCTRSDLLLPGVSYPAITLTVDVATGAAASITNTVTVSGGGDVSSGNDSASDPTTIVPLADLTILKSHTGSFTAGQTGASYSVVVSNSASAGATAGTVTVSDTLPAGLTATAASGTGWGCTVGATVSCTRSDVLAAGASYPAITLTVNVASNAPASITNTATVSGGGDVTSGNNTSSDLTTIVPLPDLSIDKSHTGTITLGQPAIYNIMVLNSAIGGPTFGTVTVTDPMPTGLTATGASGTGWSCTVGATVTCTRSDVLAAGASYPEITLMVNVASDAPAVITNTATVSGGGDNTPVNNSDSDTSSSIAVPDLSITKSHTGTFAPGQTASYSIVVANQLTINGNSTLGNNYSSLTNGSPIKGTILAE